MATRIYLATVKKLIKTEQQPRLVEAGNPAQTRLHVTKDIYEIRPATSKEVAALMGQGVKVEMAGDELEGQEPLDIGA